MNDSELEDFIVDLLKCMDTGRGLSTAEIQKFTTLFTQALTARLDAVAGALPEKLLEWYTAPTGQDYQDKDAHNYNVAIDACHAAIDTVRRRL